jgi:PAS domain S-box-containing protein
MSSVQPEPPDDYLSRAYRHLEQLRRTGAPVDAAALEQAFDELEAALVQLRVANEDLSKKNLELAAEHLRFQQLFDLAPDAFFATDINGIIADANRASAALLSVSQTELVGKPLAVYVAEPDRREFRLRLNRLPDAPLQEWDLHVRSRDEQTCAVACRVSVAPHRAGQPSLLHWILHDVSERERMERELAAINSRLETRVKERTAELERAHDQLRLLGQRLVSLLEDERRRISRELHDEIGQALVAIRMGLEGGRQLLPAGSDALRSEIGRASDLARDTVDRLRHLAYELRPPSVDLVDLNTLLEGLCSDVNRRARLPVAYRGPGDLPAVDPAVKLTLYRVLQESLANAVKHSGATRVSVGLDLTDGAIVLTVEDDGSGFDVARVLRGGAEGQAIGLVGMRERLQMLGGTLELDSVKGRGTRVAARIPRG